MPAQIDIIPNDIVASTLIKYSDKVEENLPRLSPMFKWLQKKSLVTDTGWSGQNYRQVLETNLNTNVGWYYGKEDLKLDETDHLAWADYYVRQFAGSIIFPGIDEIMNSGREQAVNYLASKMKNLEKSMQHMLAASAHFDGTEVDGKGFGGIRQAVRTNPSTGLLGKIDRASAEDNLGRKYWQNKVVDLAGLPARGATIPLGKMTRAYNRIAIDTQNGPNKVDLCVADKSHYIAYIEELQEKQFITDKETAGFGFTNVMHAGLGCPIVNDYMMPEQDRTFCLDTDTIALRKSKRWMKTLPKSRPVNQDIEATTIVGAGNITYSNLERQGLVFGTPLAA